MLGTAQNIQQLSRVHHCAAYKAISCRNSSEHSLVEAKQIVARGRVSNTNGTPGNAMPTTKNPEAMGLLGDDGKYEGIIVDYLLMLF